MPAPIPVRLLAISVVLVLAVAWALGAAAEAPSDYPNADLLATVEWLDAHAGEPGLVIVDVRNDEHFHGEVIPGAIRMPWGQFRTTDPVVGVSGVFVGVNRAQELLGEHGIQRTDTVVLYDSVERDGGATASYVFWVLDYLGHENVKVLDGGIDAWKRAGLETAVEPAEIEAVVYQAPPEDLQRTALVEGPQIQARLGDRYYEILDVRSRDEYLGETPNADWQGKALKLGHVPGAYNVDYKNNWIDEETKLLKPYAALQAMYAGLDPRDAVITYCHTARRSSYTYFVLRLMGFADVRLYDYSWAEWGKKSLFYPVETRAHELVGPAPGAVSMVAGQTQQRTRQPRQRNTGSSAGDRSNGGYISCGG